MFGHEFIGPSRVGSSIFIHDRHNAPISWLLHQYESYRNYLAGLEDSPLPNSVTSTSSSPVTVYRIFYIDRAISLNVFQIEYPDGHVEMGSDNNPFGSVTDLGFWGPDRYISPDDGVDRIETRQQEAIREFAARNMFRPLSEQDMYTIGGATMSAEEVQRHINAISGERPMREIPYIAPLSRGNTGGLERNIAHIDTNEGRNNHVTPRQYRKTPIEGYGSRNHSHAAAIMRAMMEREEGDSGEMDIDEFRDAEIGHFVDSEMSTVSEVEMERYGVPIYTPHIGQGVTPRLPEILSSETYGFRIDVRKFVLLFDDFYMLEEKQMFAANVKIVMKRIKNQNWYRFHGLHTPGWKDHVNLFVNSQLESPSVDNGIKQELRRLTVNTQTRTNLVTSGKDIYQLLVKLWNKFSDHIRHGCNMFEILQPRLECWVDGATFQQFMLCPVPEVEQGGFECLGTGDSNEAKELRVTLTTYRKMIQCSK
eukprot:scaffold32648_cov94-Skeletonema_dohrnii-CCMP3373.AAC.1